MGSGTKISLRTLSHVTSPVFHGRLAGNDKVKSEGATGAFDEISECLNYMISFPLKMEMRHKNKGTFFLKRCKRTTILNAALASLTC